MSQKQKIGKPVQSIPIANISQLVNIFVVSQKYVSPYFGNFYLTLSSKEFKLCEIPGQFFCSFEVCP